MFRAFWGLGLFGIRAFLGVMAFQCFGRFRVQGFLGIRAFSGLGFRAF